MPAKVKVKIIAGRNLPVMDRSNDTTDAYVELKLGATSYKTDVCKKSLNPCWNTDWFRFEVDDTELQDEPLQIRLMDYDTYSANDLIGKVYVDLNPLLVPKGSFIHKIVSGSENNSSSENFTNTIMSGWIPVYDTLLGIRGDINIMVKVELFYDFNRFRQSSCGVHFFCSPSVPLGYYTKSIYGFVEELIVNDDPEYQWIDKIRTPRASNEAKQFLLFKLYGELQRKIGMQALELGANAVIGYSHCFDFEGDFGIVARGIGTAVTLVKAKENVNNTDGPNEENAQNYMQFLRYDSGFHLGRNDPSQFSPSFSTSAPQFPFKQKRAYSNPFSDNRTLSTSSNSILHDHINQASSLQTLLQQEDSRRSPARGLIQHFRNVRYSSRSRLSKRMMALRARISDESSNFSLLDPRKKKHMAEMLVNSIMSSSFDSVKNNKQIYVSDGKSTIGNQTGKSVSEPQLRKKSVFATVSNSSFETSSSTDDAPSQEVSQESNSVTNVNKGFLLENVHEEVHNAPILEKPTLVLKTKNSLTMAPLAEFESFDEDVQGNTSNVGTVCESIIPDIPPCILSISDSTLTKTAMQTMLLERVNIIGTYTPPSSPFTANKATSMFNLPYHTKMPIYPSTSVNNTAKDILPFELNTLNIPVKTVVQSNNNMHASLDHSLRICGSPVAETTRNGLGHQRTESLGGKSAQSPLKSNLYAVTQRRSSDSDLSITPKGSSLTESDKSYGPHSGGFVTRLGPLSRSGIQQENYDLLDYPFVTMNKFPVGYIINFGGIVSARSVKRLDRLVSSEVPESRSLWWNELRLEIRSHTRSLNCNAVLAYTEHATVCEGICILNASGTAAIVGDIGECSQLSPSSFKFSFMSELQKEKINSTMPPTESPESSPSIHNSTPCTICHLPYIGTFSVLQNMTVHKCAMCRLGNVSDLLLSTTEIPDDIPSVGFGCFIQAQVCRQLKDYRNEPSAKEVSDCLPFLEYELHRLLVNKMKIKGMNALFGLKVRISIGSKILVGVATGTGVFLLPLQPLQLPMLVANQFVDEKKVADMQKLLQDTVKTNREIYQLKQLDDAYLQLSPDVEVLDDEIPTSDSTYENRDCSVLEVDDPDDLDIMNLLMEPRPPDGFHVVNTESVPGLEEMDIVKCLQMFTQIWRTKIHFPYNLGKHVNKILQSVYFKLRSMIPCALCNLQFSIDLPDVDEIQLSIIGMALGLSTAPKVLKSKTQNSESEDDSIFVLEGDFNENMPLVSPVPPVKLRNKSPQRFKMDSRVQDSQEWHGVEVTSTSYVPGARIERYLGNLNLFFIRESTSVREEGGLSGFMHRFVTEVLAIVRSHITALGGNALLSYYMTQCVISHSIHKNQGQCLINVGGDVVFVSYSNEE